MHILFLTAFTLFYVHSASETYSIDDFFPVPQSPQPYYYFSVAPPQGNQGIDTTAAMYTLLDDVPIYSSMALTTQATEMPISQQQYDLTWIDTMLNAYSCLSQDAATTNIGRTEPQTRVCKECGHECNKDNFARYMLVHREARRRGKHPCDMCALRYASVKAV